MQGQHGALMVPRSTLFFRVLKRLGTEPRSVRLSHLSHSQVRPSPAILRSVRALLPVLSSSAEIYTPCVARSRIWLRRGNLAERFRSTLVSAHSHHTASLGFIEFGMLITAFDWKCNSRKMPLIAHGNSGTGSAVPIAFLGEVNGEVM